jgi:lysophospholipase L1-like esterase
MDSSFPWCQTAKSAPRTQHIMATWSLWDFAPNAVLASLFSGPAPAADRRPALLLLGDSITELGAHAESSGWIALLQSRYNRSVDIDCRGLGGYNTKWVVQHVLQVVGPELDTWLSPSLVTVWFGANDAALPDGDAKVQHVPLDDYRANLQTIVAMFKAKSPLAKILLITPPHVDDSRRRNAQGKLDRSNASAGEYARACVEEAGKAGVAVLDLYTFFNAMPEAKRNSFLEDGLHFNIPGNKVVDEQLRAKIHSAFPDLVPQLEKWQLPDWHAFASGDVATTQ